MSVHPASVHISTESGDSDLGGNMKVRSILGAGSALLLCLGTVALAAPTASAANCRPSLFGTNDLMGTQRYDCPDGSYQLKKPFGAQGWNDPWASYELRPNNGSSWNRPSQKCRYDSFWNRYTCR